MTKAELEKAFSDALENFKVDMQASFDEYSKEPATKGDLAELARHTFYALHEMRKALITYLD